MNLKQIETFFWAAKLGSFTAAAERLYATQSTVSMRINELEYSLGIKLFDRSQRNARLTTKGRELLKYAERIITVMNEMAENIASPESLSGLVRLGVAEVISLTWLPDLVEAVRTRYPRVTLELDEALTGDLLERLETGRLDIALVPGKPRGANYNSEELGFVEFHWMASPNFKLPDGVLRPEELAELPIIALSPESCHHATIERWFREAGVRCKRVDTCKSMGVMAALATAGLGLGLLPIRCFQRELKEGQLRLLDTAPAMPPVRFYASTLSDAEEPVIRAVAALTLEICDFKK